MADSNVKGEEKINKILVRSSDVSEEDNEDASDASDISDTDNEDRERAVKGENIAAFQFGE